jgi:hypothetical protein
MKKRCVIVSAALSATLVSLGGSALAQSVVTAQVPGNTVVQDPAGDLLLKNCSTTSPDAPCSLPPSAPLSLPGYFDVKTARITQIGGGRVNLFIAPYQPIPAAPLEPFISYFWQFQDGCTVPSPTDKDGIRVHWDGDAQTWSANWFVITSCNPRDVVQGDPVTFQFTEDGVKVQVTLSELLENGSSPGSPIEWYAGVRRLPFSHPTFTRTVPVDVAPDVVEFNPDPPPALLRPQDPAIWEPQASKSG